MRVPTRKPGKYTNQIPDQYMTREKFDELKEKVERMKKFSRPRAAEEVKRLALMGDFSENVAYQMAKGKLRGINQRILDTENLLKRAVIIVHKNNNSSVQIGHRVTVEISGKQRIYQILGSSETDPTKGIISHISLVGSSLLGKHINDIVKIKSGEKIIEYKILKIE